MTVFAPDEHGSGAPLLSADPDLYLPTASLALDVLPSVDSEILTGSLEARYSDALFHGI
ncbi:hypothetical protein [Microvirga massiliensis]|uniref:hypothetical protein n=1 Tax=Microvirga massiliensis TaxID=1033741 RepID=UPI000A69AF8E|nr:hypothetical protein [Microvirga massiliensis]